MAPFAFDSLADDAIYMANSKPKSVVSNGNGVSKPVADNFMYDFKYNHCLPTTDILGVDVPVGCDAQKEAEAIVVCLSGAMSTGNAKAFAGLFIDYGSSSPPMCNDACAPIIDLS